MDLFGFTSTPELLIDFHTNNNTTVSSDINGSRIFTHDEDIKGILAISLSNEKTYPYCGLEIQFLGQIQHLTTNETPYEFTNLSVELEPKGISNEYTKNTQYTFDFSSMEKKYETYHGKNIELKYIVRIIMRRSFPHFTDLVKDYELIIYKQGLQPTLDTKIKMEVGIEECLHLEFEYNQSHYHLDDVVIGKIYFLLVRIKIKYMELAILRKENIILKQGESKKNETMTICQYEIMDGLPIKGESIPVRMYLNAYADQLTPTFKNIENQFSVNYFLNIVLVDEQDRRYFKQQEIILWRK